MVAGTVHRRGESNRDGFDSTSRWSEAGLLDDCSEVGHEGGVGLFDRDVTCSQEEFRCTDERLPRSLQNGEHSLHGDSVHPVGSRFCRRCPSPLPWTFCEILLWYNREGRAKGSAGGLDVAGGKRFFQRRNLSNRTERAKVGTTAEVFNLPMGCQSIGTRSARLERQPVRLALLALEQTRIPPSRRPST